MSAVAKHPWRSSRVGSYDGCSSKSVAIEIRRRLNNYMTFMNDPALNTPERLAAGYPETRSSWPGIDGSPTDAQSSPLAHRKFFEWQVRSSGGRTTAGEPCMDVGAIRNLLSSIGMDLTVCSGHDVAEALAHNMDKGGDDNCITWPEYLNSMFSVGPASDSGAPDPTTKQSPKVSMAEVSRRLQAESDAKAKAEAAKTATLQAARKTIATATANTTSGITWVRVAIGTALLAGAFAIAKAMMAGAK